MIILILYCLIFIEFCTIEKLNSIVTPQALVEQKLAIDEQIKNINEYLDQEDTLKQANLQKLNNLNEYLQSILELLKNKTQDLSSITRKTKQFVISMQTKLYDSTNNSSSANASFASLQQSYDRLSKKYELLLQRMVRQAISINQATSEFNTFFTQANNSVQNSIAAIPNITSAISLARQSYQQRLADLTNAFKIEQAKHTDSNQTQQDLLKEIDQLKINLNTQQQENQDLTSSQQATLEKVLSLSATMNEIATAQQKFSSLFEQLNQAIKNLKSNDSSTAKKQPLLQQPQDQNNDDLDTLQASLQSLQQENQFLTDSQQKVMQTILYVSNLLGNFSSTLQTTNQSLPQLMKILKTRKTSSQPYSSKELDSLAVQNATLKKTLRVYEQNYQQNATNLTELQSTYHNMFANLQDITQATIPNLKNSIKQALSKRQTLTDAANYANIANINRINQTVSQNLDTIASINQILRPLITEISASKSKNATLNQQVLSLQNALAQAQNINSRILQATQDLAQTSNNLIPSISQKISTAQSKAQALMLEKSNQDYQTESLQNQLNQLMQERNQLALSMQFYEGQARNLTETVQDLQTQLQQALETKQASATRSDSYSKEDVQALLEKEKMQATIEQLKSSQAKQELNDALMQQKLAFEQQLQAFKDAAQEEKIALQQQLQSIKEDAVQRNLEQINEQALRDQIDDQEQQALETKIQAQEQQELRDTLSKETYQNTQQTSENSSDFWQDLNNRLNKLRTTDIPAIQQQRRLIAQKQATIQNALNAVNNTSVTQAPMQSLATQPVIQTTTPTAPSVSTDSSLNRLLNVKNALSLRSDRGI